MMDPVFSDEAVLEIEPERVTLIETILQHMSASDPNDIAWTHNQLEAAIHLIKEVVREHELQNNISLRTARILERFLEGRN